MVPQLHSPVDKRADLLQNGLRSTQHLVRIGDVEQVRFEVHGLRQDLPPLKLIGALTEHNIL